MRPDLIVCADTVHTMAGSPATAVALQDGVIAAIGDRRDVADWRGPGTEVVDLGDCTVMPGPHRRARPSGHGCGADPRRPPP